MFAKTARGLGVLSVLVVSVVTAGAAASESVSWRSSAPGSETTRMSVSSTERQGNRASTAPDASSDGRYVVFESLASNLVPGDTNGVGDVFVRDRVSGTTGRVSVSSTERQGNRASHAADVSSDGRYVVFESLASNLVPGDTNGVPDVFVRDRVSGTTGRVSVSSTEGQAEFGRSDNPAISADGRYVAFVSSAENLVPHDTNGWEDVFVRDRTLGITRRVSLSSTERQANWFSGYTGLGISATGRYVAFESIATNLVRGDTNGVGDVFVRDRRLDITLRMSVSSTERQTRIGDSWGPTISADGRYVAFTSDAPNLVPDDTNHRVDVFVRDRRLDITRRVSVSSTGTQADHRSSLPAISASGRFVAFTSAATNLVPADTNGRTDIFGRARGATW